MYAVFGGMRVSPKILNSTGAWRDDFSEDLAADRGTVVCGRPDRTSE
jgi:hypothetical protein